MKQVLSVQNQKCYIISSFQKIGNLSQILNEPTKKSQKFTKSLHFSLKTNCPIHAQLLMKPKWTHIRSA